MREKPTDSEVESVLALAEKIRFLDIELKALLRGKVSDYESYEEFEEKVLAPYWKKSREFLAEYTLSPDEMRLVVEYKKAKAGAERQLNCRVFEDIRSDEFRDYLKSIIGNGEVGQRFQVMALNLKAGLAPHWSTADILIEKDGIRILHFDAIKAVNDRLGGFRKGGLNGDILEEVLKSLESSKPISVVDAYMQMDGQHVDLQHENRSCALFATATALDMSKIPALHAIAKTHEVRFEDSPVKNNVTRYSIDALYLPASFIRNAQSRSLIDYYEAHQPEALKIIPRKSGPKKLKEYVDSRSHKISDSEKLQNFGIMHSREHYKKIAAEKKQEDVSEKDAGGPKKK